MNTYTRKKNAVVPIETSPTDGSGTFEGLASTFDDVPDHQGDIIAPGAFLKSIVNWRQRKMYPPIFAEHAYDQLDSRVGDLTRMSETDEGLLVTGRLNLKSPRATALYEALLIGTVDSMSIGYGVHAEHKRADGVNVLDEVDVFEVSIVVTPANPRARIMSVKSAKVGQRNSAEDQSRIQAAHDALVEAGASCKIPYAVAPYALEDPTKSRDPLLCRRGHRVAAPKVRLGSGVKSTYCASCRSWEVRGSVYPEVARQHVALLEKCYGQFPPGAAPAPNVELQRLTKRLDALASPTRRYGDTAKVIAGDRRERVDVQRDEQRLAEVVASLSLMPGQLIPGAEEDRQRDRERFEREQAEIAARDAERAREADDRELRDEELRTLTRNDPKVFTP